jgi:hypothetical protein
LADGTEWFVDTIEGRLHDEFVGPRTSGVTGQGRIYWRPQGTGVLWQHALVPLHPDDPRLGDKSRNGLWYVYEFSGVITNQVRLLPPVTIATLPFGSMPNPSAGEAPIQVQSSSNT